MSAPAPTPDVSVVLVTHDHAEDLRACLSSLRAAMVDVDAELVLIDNRSRDASFEIASASAPTPSTVTRNRARRGFAANVNEGIRRSGADAILVLNPDTVIDQAAIAELLAYMQSHPRVGVLAPALYSPDGQLQPSCRRFPTLRSAIARRTPFRRWLRQSGLNRRHLMLDEEISGPQQVDWALGACLLLSRSALDDVGLFDEGYPLYVEDIDLCYRMHQRAWQVVYMPAARVEHRHLAVTDQRWLTRRTFAHYRGMLRFLRKHGLRRR
jgi:hypothetical protein